MSVTEALMKVCCRCGLPKPATRSYFHRSAKNKDQLDPRCRVCRKTPGTRVSVATLDIRPREERVVDTHKHCLKCKQRKPMEEFRECSKGFAGRFAYCFDCDRKKHNDYQKQHRAESWENRLIQNARTAHYSGKKRKKVLNWALMDLDAEYLRELLVDQDSKCGWTGVQFSLKEIGKPWSVSLDRLDCSQGYVRGNVMLVCMAANLARNDATPEEMLAFIQMIKEV